MRASFAVWIAVAVSAAAATAQEDPVQQPKADKATNHLANESSPYLRQHRQNPVDWYPWGDEALALAKKLDKPIFLSIGYSACHWCHVMEEESFEDEDIAKLMNEHFVCIKVDREERPDIDEIYMTAVQAMGVPGGWPLSAWLTPEGKPFYGGTYFPPEDGNGRPGFRRVCQSLGKAWKDDRDKVLGAAGELSEHLQGVLAPKYAPGEPTEDLLGLVAEQAAERFDPEHKGIANPPQFAPKFPAAIELRALLQLEHDADAHAMVFETLHAMRRGGMHDQLGGGFHRYSTDRMWLVPHFEKMLYDNALLASLYVDAFAATGDAEFAEAARTTFVYVLRELTAPEGGFWSSQDAQSEGVEGKYFVWQKQEIDALLGDDAPLLCRALGVTADGNWEHTNVLWRAEEVEPVERPRLVAAKQRLLQARGERVPPGTDDKVLVCWNGLMIRAFCDGFRVLGDERYRAAARRSAAFLCDKLVDADGRVRRSWQGGRARHQGLLEDHASLAEALLSLFEVDPDPRWLQTAQRVLEQIASRFRAEDGAFYATADDHEALIARVKSAYDAATPSGTAMAARAFLRGGLLLGDEQLYGYGVGTLRAYHGLLDKTPANAPALVQALQFHVGSPKEVVVVGPPGHERTQALLRAVWRWRRPCVVAHLHDGNREALEELSRLFVGKQLVDGQPAVYICERGACQRPVTDPAELER